MAVCFCGDELPRGLSHELFDGDAMPAAILSELFPRVALKSTYFEQGLDKEALFIRSETPETAFCGQTCVSLHISKDPWIHRVHFAADKSALKTV
jgi:hypothetical protein